MALWDNKNSKNSAPKFVTDAANAQSGIDEFNVDVIFVYGNEGYPVQPGWARRITKGNRVMWESLVAISEPYKSIPEGYTNLLSESGTIQSINTETDSFETVIVRI